jgi:phage N-6-adenine-methyltransferase
LIHSASRSIPSNSPRRLRQSCPKIGRAVPFEGFANRGVLVAVEYDENGNVLDGHHPIRACEVLGITDWPRIVRLGLDEASKRPHARKLNLARRHLDQVARRALIEQQLRDTPERSNRQIADDLGVDDTTVGDVRRAVAGIPQVRTTTGADGKSYPASKLERAAKRELIARQIREKPEASNRQIADELGVSDHTVAAVRATPTGYRLVDTSPEGKKAIKDSARAVLKADMPTYTGNNEWYTPAENIEAARAALGVIDLDPASCDRAQEVVRAGKYFTAETDGLKQEWSGNVWLNPPYSHPLVSHFVSKLCDGYNSGHVTSAILLVNNYTDNAWFHEAEESAAATCFTRGRIKFYGRGDEKSSPADGQVFIYFGDNVQKFAEVFSEFGVCFRAAVRPADFAMAQAA